ncbi:MDR family MFS transporter [Agreia sp. PsM10]|uniref:MDR family MFS transporter n=1 Tax=Agreia sp. PsM10 TaxID=3030533 RepID=UPI00263B2DE6|nr:MDR family MFS transporter [Agreia sp. PsM10]MDN4642315.1 MDR family MFS transporter [Agreia sp. PsM10]
MPRTNGAAAGRAKSTSADRARAAAESGGVLSPRQIKFIIFGLMAGMFLAALDQSIVGTSMRTIGDDLKGQDQQAWVTTAYLVVSTIATPIYGKLSDIFGRRPLYIIAISIFILGSLLAGISTSMLELAGFRAIQGLGAGGLMSLALTVMGDILAPRERAKYQGYFLAVFGVSSVLGPLLGGLISGTNEIFFITGWRWIFLLNLPVAAIAMVLVVSFLHIPHTRRDTRIDWWGAAFIVMGIAPLLLVAENGRDWGWGSVGAFACYIIGAVGIVAFILVERRMGSNALIPLSLFRSSTFSMASVIGTLVGFGMFGGMLTLPLYLQIVNGATPTESGLLMIPMVVGLMIASIVSGQVIARTGKYKIFPIVGTFLMSAAFFYLTFATATSGVVFIMGGMLMLGLGLGQLMQTLTIASQNSVGPRDIGVATSAATFFRQIGGTLGTAVIFSVVFSRAPDAIKTAFGDPDVVAGITAASQDPKVVADQANVDVLTQIQLAQSGQPNTLGQALNGDTSFLNLIDPRLARPFLDGFSSAMVTGFYISLGVVLLAFLLSWFLKATPLRQKSALQEASDDAAALAASNESSDAEREDAAALEMQLEASRAAGQAGAMIEPTTGSVPAQKPRE